MAIETLLKKFPDAGTPEKATDQLAEWFDSALEDSGLTFEKDIEPWVGKQIAIFVADVDPAGDTELGALVATDDEDATKAAVQRAINSQDVQPSDETYKGVEYKTFLPPQQATEKEVAVGVTEGFLVVGTESAFKSVVDSGDGSSLAEADVYKDAVAKLAKDRVALFFYNLDRVGKTLESAPGYSETDETQKLLDITKGQAAAGAVYARGDAIVLETSQSLSGDGDLGSTLAKLSDVDLIPKLSSDVWGAFAIGGFGDYLELALDSFASAAPEMGGVDAIEQQVRGATGLDLKKDLLSWIGDMGVFVEGADLQTVGGGILIESESPETSSATIKKLARRLGAQGLPVRRAAGGFEVAIPGGQPIHVVSSGDRVVIAYGAQAARGALASGDRLASGETFTRASGSLGEGYSVLMYADLSAAITFFEQLAPEMPTTYTQEVKPNLAPLDYLIAGQSKNGDSVLTRLVIGVK
jgi:hypothetical protein